MDFRSLLALVNDPILKPLLLIFGGVLLKKWEPFFNRAIPVVLATCSALVSLLAALFPALVPDASPAFFVAGYIAPAGFVASAAAVWASPIVSALVPVWLASGMQSTAKNTRQWAKAGWTIWTAAGR